MPNIAAILKEEIVRLARKELRGETERLKQTVSTQRSELTALKRRMADLEKQNRTLHQAVVKAGLLRPQREAAEGEAGTRIRFSAKGLTKHRERLGLSAQAFGMLVGVSAQTIYNWEAGKAKPRASQLASLATLRSMGKRAAKKALGAMTATPEDHA